MIKFLQVFVKPYVAAYCTSAQPSEKEMGKPKERYGYIVHEDGEYSKRDRSVEGLLHLGIIKLPEALKESLKLYYKSEFLFNRIFSHKRVL